MNINQFRQSLAGGGARPNLFAVELNAPPGLSGDFGGKRAAPFMIKTSSIPGVNIGPVDVPYMGRILKLAGNTTFDDWETTIINDEDFRVRRMVEAWAELINGKADNLASSSSPDQYMANASVVQFSKTGKPIREYSMIGAFPTAIAPIELGWDSNDALEEFSVTWAFSWWETKDTTFDASGTGALAAKIEVDTPLGDFSGSMSFGKG
tara:strand:- start:1031 stop:1654 length:624 start_codon:yes stop_codon:yes gene_type:complete